MCFGSYNDEINDKNLINQDCFYSQLLEFMEIWKY